MKMKVRLFASAKISPGIRRTPNMCTGNHTKLGMRSPSSNAINTLILSFTSTLKMTVERSKRRLLLLLSFIGKSLPKNFSIDLKTRKERMIDGPA